MWRYRIDPLKNPLSLNYRPIWHLSNLLKDFELTILNILEGEKNQIKFLPLFSKRINIWTTDAALLQKKTIHHHLSYHKSQHYLCILSSKAFDDVLVDNFELGKTHLKCVRCSFCSFWWTIKKPNKDCLLERRRWIKISHIKRSKTRAYI